MAVGHKAARRSNNGAGGKNGNDKPFIPPSADSKALSWAAETADGTRDQLLRMSIVGDHLQVGKPTPNAPTDPSAIDIFTASRQKARPRTTRAELYLEGGSQPIEIDITEADPWDVVFWTESSIEKFLWPYYHSHRLWDDDMTKLQAQFDGDPHAVAIAHKAPSASSIISAVDITGVALAERDELGILSVEWLTGREYLELSKTRAGGTPQRRGEAGERGGGRRS